VNSKICLSCTKLAFLSDKHGKFTTVKQQFVCVSNKTAVPGIHDMPVPPIFPKSENMPILTNKDI
jgi:hypothetical protein